MPPRTSRKAIAALVCSILGFLIPLILAVTGLILAGQARRQIRSSGGTIDGERLATAATVLSIVGLLTDGIALVVIVGVVFITRSG
jgi:Domain of unknown function (DUF4190)